MIGELRHKLHCGCIAITERGGVGWTTELSKDCDRVICYRTSTEYTERTGHNAQYRRTSDD